MVYYFIFKLSSKVQCMVVGFTIFNLAGLILYLTKIILYVNYDGSRCDSSIVVQV